MRSRSRYNHITIGLQCQIGEAWEAVSAMDWNESGFNFCHSEIDLAVTSLHFRRRSAYFEGTLTWRIAKVEDEVLQAMVVNELLTEKAQSLADSTLKDRLMALVRSTQLTPEKLSVLQALGTTLSPDALQQATEARRVDGHLVHYGVLVQDPAWSDIVDKALHISAPVLSLEKLVNDLRAAGR